MKKKILLIIALIFICAGCDVKYTLKIDQDLKVEEYVSATEPDKFFENFPKSSRGKVVADILSQYTDVLNENNYDTKSQVGAFQSGAIVSKSYPDLKTYSDETIFTSQFSDDKVEVTEKDNIVTLRIYGNFSHSEQNQSKVPVDTAKIRIEIPFKVTDKNCHEVDGNTYIWNFDEDSLDREIRISFDKSKVAKETKSFDYSYLIIIGAVIVLAFIGYLLYNRIGKRSKEVNDL